MTGRTDIIDGDAGWHLAQPLLETVWPPEMVATLPWCDVTWAHADRRVLVFADAGDLICHVGIFWRHATWDGRPVKVGGIGGVATRPDCRQRGVASAAMRRAEQEVQASALDFAVLFCEPGNAPLYRSLGWQNFAGEVFAEQPAGRTRFDMLQPYMLFFALAPRDGVLDLCGLPW